MSNIINFHEIDIYMKSNIHDVNLYVNSPIREINIYMDSNVHELDIFIYHYAQAKNIIPLDFWDDKTLAEMDNLTLEELEIKFT